MKSKKNHTKIDTSSRMPFKKKSEMNLKTDKQTSMFVLDMAKSNYMPGCKRGACNGQ